MQLTLAGTEPPDRLNVPEPGLAVSVPPHVPMRLFGVAITIPAGKLSVNAIPARVTVFAAGLVRVNVSVEVPFGAIRFGVKDFAREGGATTVTDAAAVPPVPPDVEFTAPVTLFFAPAVVPVTFTENVHELLAAIVPPDKPMLCVPAAAVIVPAPHEPVRPLGPETTNPAGKVSVNATPTAPAVAFVF